MPSSTKTEKEDFVSGLEGSTVWQALLPTLLVPVALLAEAHIKAVLELRHNGGMERHGRLPRDASLEGEADPAATYARARLQPPTSGGAVVAAVLLLALTVPIDSPVPTGLLMLLLVASAGCRVYLAGRRLAAWRLAKANNLFSAHKNFVSAFRGSTMLVTCFCILAVDFPCFPRQYGKTETFGTGLMDLGVGLFVVSSALTSKWARAHDMTFRGPGAPEAELTMARKVPGALLAAGPLVLGVLRLVVLKAIDYQEHVSEYGTNWNFFLSLACIHNLAAAAHWCVPKGMLLPVSIACIVLHQYALVARGGALTEWVLTAPRGRGFVADNREGLLGILPLTGLYLVGEDISRRTLWGKTTGSQRRFVELWRYRFLKMGALTGALWLAYFFLSRAVQPTSRRLSNGSYVVWVLASALSLLLAFGAADLVSPVVPSAAIVSAMNRHQLPTFLAANLLTGAVNISVSTLHVSDTFARAILAVYALLVMATPVVLEHRRMRPRAPASTPAADPGGTVRKEE